ncbi:hypothetical protein ACTXG6_06060 [Pseudonocardia sp. Cha107L01]|uniref:hypothetical protein n=1 Tax=Pseudonocardia sp. Cha107L01 TaxID=3457576 RepID=UPI00403EA33B
MTTDGLPPGLSRRQFLEDVLDVLGDKDAVLFPDGSTVTRMQLLEALAKEMDS